MASPNMTVEGMKRWRQTEAYKEYREDHDARQVTTVVKRALRVIRGEASEEDERKVENFISRMKANSSGKRKYGSGTTAVSARTASLRNWGYDPTGRFT